MWGGISCPVLDMVTGGHGGEHRGSHPVLGSWLGTAGGSPASPQCGCKCGPGGVGRFWLPWHLWVTRIWGGCIKAGTWGAAPSSQGEQGHSEPVGDSEPGVTVSWQVVASPQGTVMSPRVTAHG